MPQVFPLWMLVPLIVLVLLGHPVGLVLGWVGLVFGILFWGPQFLPIIVTRFFEFQTNYLLVSIPLFVFMGNVLERSGIADGLYESLNRVLAKVKGGLALATILVASIFATTTGVVSASTTSIGLIALPSMVKRGYDHKLAAGVVMAGGCLGILIPPSIMLVVVGAWAQLSVGRLYLGAFIPGFLLAGIYMLYIWIRCKMRPELAPTFVLEREDGDREAKGLLFNLIPPLVLIFAVLGTIVIGVATPTEAAGVGALGSLIIAALKKRLTLSDFLEACYRTVRLCGVIALIACGALTFASAFLGLGGDRVVEELLLGLGLGKYGVLIVMMACLLLMGCFMDWFEILVITIPIFFPIAQKLGFDPIWYGVLVSVNLQMSFLTPPYGLALFYLKGLSSLVAPEVRTDEILKSAVPFVLLICLCIVLLILFPQLVLWLPQKLMG